MNTPDTQFVIAACEQMLSMIDRLSARVTAIEKTLLEHPERMPIGVQAATQMVAACCHSDAISPSLLAEQFEMLHQSVCDRIKHELRNVHTPAPADFSNEEST
jgi:hypothetical protein